MSTIDEDEGEDAYDELRNRKVDLGPYVDAKIEGKYVNVQVSSTFESDLRRRIVAEVGRMLADIRFAELEETARVQIVKAMMSGSFPTLDDPAGVDP